MQPYAGSGSRSAKKNFPTGWPTDTGSRSLRPVSLELLYSDLQRVAQHRGSLDAEAVRSASTLLALPRYADYDRPAELLAQDIEDVVRAIGDDEVRRGAELFFSLDPERQGETFTHRLGALQPRHGTADKWATRAILHRVLVGLLELPLRPDGREGDGPRLVGYSVDRLHLIRTWRPSSPMRPVDQLDFELSLLSRGPHCLALPRRTSRLKLSSIRSLGSDQEPAVEWAHLSSGRWPSRDRALVFGRNQSAGDRLALSVEHKIVVPSRLFGNYPRPSPNPPSLSYQVTQPIGEFVLQVDLGLSKSPIRYSIVVAVTRDSVHVVHEGAEPAHRILAPELGITYWIVCYANRPPLSEELARIRHATAERWWTVTKG